MKKYYVYVLIDPITGKIFYVGKGLKLRMYIHVKDVKRNRIPNGNNIYLERKIKKILLLEKKVEYKKVFINENEQDAFNKEIELIKEIGLENLCNLTDGGEGLNYWLGKHRSEETKRKISEANKGKIAWNKGKKHTDEAKIKMSMSHIGKKHSEETKKKISKNNAKWNLGMNLSEETKRKISQTLTGRKLSDEHKRKMSKYRIGKKHSDETKQKLSEAKKGKNNPMFGKSTWMKGRKHSEETKKKISKTLKERNINK